MFKTVDGLLKNKWTSRAVSEKLAHLKPTQTTLSDRYVKGRKGQIGATFTVKIKTGAEVILESITSETEHLIHDGGDIVESETKTTRYALANPITPEKLNQTESFQREDKTLSLTEEIGDIQKEHKEFSDTSIEYQTTGALFNEVMDRKEEVLFELNYNGVMIELRANKPLRESITEAIRHIRNILGFQKAKISPLAGPTLMDKLNQKRLEEGLFRQNQAKWIGKNGISSLEVYRLIFEKYVTTYKNSGGEDKQFIPNDSCVFLPEDGNIFKLRYSRTSGTKATNMKPALYFGAVEELAKGGGWEVRSKCKPLIYNSRPAATPKSKFI